MLANHNCSSTAGGDTVAGAAAGEASDSSGWSDVELEDVAVIKLRAVTPPWQQLVASAGHKRGSAGRPMGVFGGRTSAAAASQTRGWGGDAAQLSARARAAAAGRRLSQEVVTSSPASPVVTMTSGDDAAAARRLQQLRVRRWMRPPERVALSEGAAAAARAAASMGDQRPAASGEVGAGGGTSGTMLLGGGTGGGDGEGVGGVYCPIPRDVVDQLLLPRYIKKYEKLGVPQRAPGYWRMQRLQMIGAFGGDGREAGGEGGDGQGDDGGCEGMEERAAGGGGIFSGRVVDEGRGTEVSDKHVHTEKEASFGRQYSNAAQVLQTAGSSG